jgi:tetratricopeptide (TPR) repeat protein
MTKSGGLRLLWVFAAAATLHSQCKLAVEAKLPDPVDTALGLAAQGNWKEASDLIEKNLSACPPGQEGSSCRKLNNFTLGYLAQEEALNCNLPNAEQTQLLQRALTSYKDSLEEPPSDGSTLNNLAAVEDELGNPNEAISVWQQAIEVDPDGAWVYALRLGDLFRNQERFEDARNQYERSATLSPDASAPRERLVETYRSATGPELRELLPALFQMEGEFPRIAKNGYELIMAREYKEQPDEADQALIRWTIVMSQQGWLSAESFTALPEDWSAPSVTELREYWQNPASSSPPWHWWLGNSDLRHIIIGVALVAGRELVNNQQPPDAIKCWETALKLAKDMQGNGPPVPPGVPSIPSPLLVEGELVFLNFQNPKLKGGYRDFRQLMMGEFHAYASVEQNLPEAQEYHTLLGMIFASKNKWFLTLYPLPLQVIGLGNQRWGAIAELSAALKVADQREKQEGFYQPLPEIKARLAQGFLATKRKRDAQQMFIKAATAYLDADSPSDATKMLEGYKEAGGTGPEAAILDRFIQYRSSPLTERPSREEVPWLYEASATFDEAFLLRQQFKVFADLIMNKSLNQTEHLDCAIQAYNLAVTQRVSLVGTTDLLRWEKVTATLLQAANVEPLPVRPLQGAELAATKRDSVTTFSFAGDLNPTGVLLSRETQTAAAIVTAVGPADALVLKNHILVRNGQAFFREASLPPEVNSILKRLEDSGAVRVSAGETGPWQE